MRKLTSLRQYFHQRSPELTVSPRRLLAALYLADWRHSIDQGSPITSVAWRLDPLGNDIITRKTAIRARSPLYAWLAPFIAPLSTSEQQAADHVIASLSGQSSAWLHQLVISTYPAITQSPGVTLDLPHLAQAYSSLKETDLSLQ